MFIFLGGGLQGAAGAPTVGGRRLACWGIAPENDTKIVLVVGAWKMHGGRRGEALEC